MALTKRGIVSMILTQPATQTGSLGAALQSVVKRDAAKGRA